MYHVHLTVTCLITCKRQIYFIFFFFFKWHLNRQDTVGSWNNGIGETHWIQVHTARQHVFIFVSGKEWTRSKWRQVFAQLPLRRVPSGPFTRAPWAVRLRQTAPVHGMQRECRSQPASLLMEQRKMETGFTIWKSIIVTQIPVCFTFALNGFVTCLYYMTVKRCSPKTQKTAAPAPANQNTGRETAPARLIWCGTVSSLPAVWKIILITPHVKWCQLFCTTKWEKTVYILKRSVFFFQHLKLYSPMTTSFDSKDLRCIM